MHSHDVRSLATWPPYVPVVGGSKEHLVSTPILVSGGLDMSLVLSPIATPSPHNAGLENVVSHGSIATFEEGHYRRLQFVQRVVRIAQKARILACMDDTTVSLWKIDREVEPCRRGRAFRKLGKTCRARSQSKDQPHCVCAVQRRYVAGDSRPLRN
jgi:hypothetical protein